MKKFIIIAGLQFAALGFFAQQETDYAKLLDDPNASLQQKQAAFAEYWKDKDKSQRGKGWKPFKRLEYFLRDRVDANGVMPDPSLAYVEWKKAHAQFEHSNGDRQLNNAQAQAAWQYIGPSSGVPSGGGAGRLCFITFDPNTPSTMWVGSPGGGLWKSTNSGANWTVVNDMLPNLGAAHLAVDPTNSNILYLSTGDRDGSDNYSVGLLKSIDGGLTWNTTGLSYNVSQMNNVNCVLIDYTNTQVLYAATGLGIYKSVDAGVNWINVKTGNFKDLKFKPGDHNTVYACGNSFARSTNAGVTWSNGSFPSPNGTIGRVAMAVTAASPNTVYVLAGQGSAQSYGFAGFYSSSNSGSSFTKVCSSPNLMGWNPSGTDTGGQAWYDLIVAANPTNANEVICGGVNTWKSTNGGTSFSLFTHWYGGGGKPYVHADCHAIEYFPTNPSNIFIGCDGGLFATTNGGTSWSMSSNGLQIGQQYRLGVSQSNQNYTITGWQDNGCSLTNQGSSVTTYVLGGDGMEAAIDPTTTTVMYGEQYNGSINKSTNTGASFNAIVGTGGTGVDEDGDWVTPYVIDPNNHNTLYVGKSQVYKSTNAGGSFTTVSNIPVTSNKIIALAVAPSNSNYIYAAKTNEVWLSTNAGSFSQVTLPYGQITYLCVDPNNEQRVWATMSGYNAGQKVFYSANAGSTWTNISGNLPNLPVKCIAYGPGTNDGLYVGTDIGVYYKDNTLPNWIFYSNGLPNVIVDELEFQIANNKLRAATYGRGLWEIGAYTAPTSPPVAAFTSNKINVCNGKSVDFYDNSTNFPSTWNWTFTGGTPSSSTLQSPSGIMYSAPGTYPVKLVVTNNAGADSVTMNSYVTVLPPPVVTMSADTTICKGDSAQLCAFGGTQYMWNPIAGLPNYYRQCPKAAPTVTKTYTATVNDINGCTGTGTVKVTVIPPPSTPVVYQLNDTLCCNISAGVSYQWYYNGNPLTGDTTQCVKITQNGAYTVQLIDTSFCHYTVNSAVFNVTNIGIKQFGSAVAVSVYPNPSHGTINIKFGTGINSQVKIFSSMGEVVYQNQLNAVAGRVYDLKPGLAAGAYFLLITDSGNNPVYTHKLIIIE